MKRSLLTIASLVIIVAGATGFSAFEAHVINVTAQIENALYVHPESFDFGTMFPQEKNMRSFFVVTSESFSATDQRRVLNIDYVIKQKPKPRPEFENQIGLAPAREWCHDNLPADPYNSADVNWQNYMANCYPVLCSYLGKQPDNFPPPGNDTGLEPFHLLTAMAYGKINKDTDPADQWLINLDVPCFLGQCAQDWTHQGWELPAELEHEVFGCDIWVEVTRIY